jgi:hypothetical protein
MRSFFLDIIVIELCSAGGCPLEEASEHCSQQSKLSFWCYSGIILVLLWCCSGYIIVYLPFLANYFCSAHYFISGILQVVSEHLPRQKIVG